MKDDIVKLLQNADKITPSGENYILTFNSGVDLCVLDTLSSVLTSDEDSVRVDDMPCTDFTKVTGRKTEIAFSYPKLKALSFYFVKDMETYCSHLAQSLVPEGWLDKEVTDRIFMVTNWNQSERMFSCESDDCQKEILRIENMFKCFRYVKTLADAAADNTLYFFIDKVLEFKEYKFQYGFCEYALTTNADDFINYFNKTGEHFQERVACFKQQLEDTLRSFSMVERPCMLMSRFDEIFKNTDYAYQRYVRRKAIDKLDALLREKAVEFLSQTQSILSSMTAEIGVIAGNILGLASLDYSNLNSMKNWMLVVCVFLANFIFIMFSRTRLTNLVDLKMDMKQQEDVLRDDVDDGNKEKVTKRFNEFYERIRQIRRNWIISCWLVWLPLVLVVLVCIMVYAKGFMSVFYHILF